VEFTILVARFGEIPWQWSFLEQWTSPDARKMKGRDLMACFNIILFYIKVSVVKGFSFNEIRYLS
jgi:hypothetical protein